MPHNSDMKTPFRLFGLVGWMGRCGVALIALAFCASAIADPSKNVVATPKVQASKMQTVTQQEVAKKLYFVPDASVREFQWRVSGSRIFRREQRA